MSTSYCNHSVASRVFTTTLAICVMLSAASSESAVIPAATPIALRPQTSVSPESTHVGDSVNLVVSSDVKVGDHVVIKAGAPALGEVVQAQKRSMIGRPDKLVVRVNSVTGADGTSVPVRGMRTIEGDDKMALSIIGGILCLFPLLIKGGRASLEPGTTIEAVTVAPVEIKAELTAAEIHAID